MQSKTEARRTSSPCSLKKITLLGRPWWASPRGEIQKAPRHAQPPPHMYPGSFCSAPCDRPCSCLSPLERARLESFSGSSKIPTATRSGLVLGAPRQAEGRNVLEGDTDGALMEQSPASTQPILHHWGELFDQEDLMDEVSMVAATPSRSTSRTSSVLVSTAPFPLRLTPARCLAGCRCGAQLEGHGPGVISRLR